MYIYIYIYIFVFNVADEYKIYNFLYVYKYNFYYTSCEFPMQNLHRRMTDTIAAADNIKFQSFI